MRRSRHVSRRCGMSSNGNKLWPSNRPSMTLKSNSVCRLNSNELHRSSCCGISTRPKHRVD